MADKNVSQVIYNGETLVDLTEDSVTAETLDEGVTAHDASGASIVGTRKVVTLTTWAKNKLQYLWEVSFDTETEIKLTSPLTLYSSYYIDSSGSPQGDGEVVTISSGTTAASYLNYYYIDSNNIYQLIQVLSSSTPFTKLKMNKGTISGGERELVFVEDVVSDNPSQFPDDGEHIDGLYYVKQ